MASDAASADILIYSTPTCPDCKSLKAWLRSLNIPFREKDLTDPSVVEEARARTGVRIAPITLFGGAILYGTFASQKPRLAALLGLAS